MKKIFSFFLVLIIALAVAGCDEDSEKNCWSRPAIVNISAGYDMFDPDIVNVDDHILIVWSKEMDPATISEDNLVLSDRKGPVEIRIYHEGIYTYITPLERFGYREEYILEISGKVADVFGNQLGEKVFFFCEGHPVIFQEAHAFLFNDPAWDISSSSEENEVGDRSLVVRDGFVKFSLDLNRFGVYGWEAGGVTAFEVVIPNTSSTSLSEVIFRIVNDTRNLIEDEVAISWEGDKTVCFLPIQTFFGDRYQNLRLEIEFTSPGEYFFKGSDEFDEGWNDRIRVEKCEVPPLD